MKTLRHGILYKGNSILHKEDFIKNFVGGKKVAREATKSEFELLVSYNNTIIRFNNELARLWNELADLEELESNLTFFIRERLESKREV